MITGTYLPRGPYSTTPGLEWLVIDDNGISYYPNCAILSIFLIGVDVGTVSITTTLYILPAFVQNSLYRNMVIIIIDFQGYGGC